MLYLLLWICKWFIYWYNRKDWCFINITKSVLGKSIISSLVAVTFIGAIGPGITNVNAASRSEVSENVEEFETGRTVAAFTNEQFFKAFEEAGYDINDYLTEEEKEEALAQDAFRSGVNTIVETSNGYDIYINGTIAAVVAGAGVGAAGAALLKVSAIAAFLKAHKITAGALTGALGVLTDKGIDFLSQGVIISLNNSFVPVGVTSQ